MGEGIGGKLFGQPILPASQRQRSGAAVKNRKGRFNRILESTDGSPFQFKCLPEQVGLSIRIASQALDYSKLCQIHCPVMQFVDLAHVTCTSASGLPNSTTITQAGSAPLEG